MFIYAHLKELVALRGHLNAPRLLTPGFAFGVLLGIKWHALTQLSASIAYPVYEEACITPLEGQCNEGPHL
jgi:hypothetical protein